MLATLLAPSDPSPSPVCLYVLQLRAEYVGVMSRVLAGHFKTYLVALEKMVSPVAGPTDVLGLVDNSSSSSMVAGGVNTMMSLFTKAVTKPNAVSNWCAGH